MNLRCLGGQPGGSKFILAHTEHPCHDGGSRLQHKRCNGRGAFITWRLCACLPEVLEGYEVHDTAESLGGGAYRAANGHLMREKGLATPPLQTETGALKRMNCRVGPVHKCLSAASEICAQGNRIFRATRFAICLRLHW